MIPALEKHPTTDTPEHVTGPESLRSASEGHLFDLLPAARRNGVRRVVRDLDSLTASISPDGDTLTVEATGRYLEYESRARLLAFADAHLTGEQ